MPDLQPPIVPGWDLAGKVTAVGSEARATVPATASWG
jgi:NADPH:quinone reductase-like Zn-dependent oxidoreductase